MDQDVLRYDKIVEGALRGVVRTALAQVAEHGLPPNHALYITFHSRFPGVDMAESLVQKYPEVMTVVLQHQFWDLDVSEDRFAVTLSFHKIRQRVTVPFAAVTGFADPPAQFGLRFEGGDPTAARDAGTAAEEAGTEAGPEADVAMGQVVNLESFRKK